MSPDRSPAKNETARPAPRRPWRLILGDGREEAGAGIAASDGPANMAVDTALLETVKAGGPPVLRLYRWSPACLSFGRNQPARARYDIDLAGARGIEFVRRPTGGQAVLHDDELTYAVIAPVSVLGKPRAAYTVVNRSLVAGLRRLGVEAALAGSGPSSPGTSGAPDWDAACFRRPERGEVVASGAKLVGSAQRMEARTILQHGSILMGGSQAPAEELLRVAVGSPSPRTPRGAGSGRASGWTTLERELGRRVPLPELADAILGGFGDVVATELVSDRLTSGERAGVAELRRRYASEEWTWRR